jgi:hypothetical protein
MPRADIQIVFEPGTKRAGPEELFLLDQRLAQRKCRKGDAPIASQIMRRRRPRECRDGERGKGRQEAVVIAKEFSDLPSRNQRHVIGGTVFLAGLAGFLAQFGVNGMERQ